MLDALLGGLLIGLGAAVLALGNGRVAGISGITARLLGRDGGPQGWRVAFVAGLLAPAVLLGTGQPAIAIGPGWLAAAGLLVGVGTQVGSGCTSGHGVCGLANLSARSLAATLAFMGMAMATVFAVRHGVAA